MAVQLSPSNVGAEVASSEPNARGAVGAAAACLTDGVGDRGDGGDPTACSRELA